MSGGKFDARTLALLNRLAETNRRGVNPHAAASQNGGRVPISSIGNTAAISGTLSVSQALPPSNPATGKHRNPPLIGAAPLAAAINGFSTRPATASEGLGGMHRGRPSTAGATRTSTTSASPRFVAVPDNRRGPMIADREVGTSTAMGPAQSPAALAVAAAVMPPPQQPSTTTTTNGVHPQQKPQPEDRAPAVPVPSVAHAPTAASAASPAAISAVTTAAHERPSSAVTVPIAQAPGNGAPAPSSVTGGNTAEDPPVISRTAAERMASTERLNLDRRGLQACPLLQGEERLRLLNYQNNSIKTIANLHTLPYLIFLDLYNNQISQISGLEQVPSLRVLMLGKNHVERIEKLDALSKLDVLDLHCNQLRSIEGLSHLSELRVLNLAGNRIERINSNGLSGLSALAELNLRRNCLACISGVETLPALQRLFLSYNNIVAMNSVSSLNTMPSLLELALDGNPLALEPSYRASILELSKTIRHLDLRRVTDEERRAALAFAKREGERRSEQQRRERQGEERASAIRQIEQAWERRVSAPPVTGPFPASTAANGGNHGAADGTKERSPEKTRLKPAVDQGRGAAAAAEEDGEEEEDGDEEEDDDDEEGEEEEGESDSSAKAEVAVTSPTIAVSGPTPPASSHRPHSARSKHLLNGGAGNNSNGSTAPVTRVPAPSMADAGADSKAASQKSNNPFISAPAAEPPPSQQPAYGGTTGSNSEVQRGHVEVTEVAAGGVWLSVYGEAAETFDRLPRSNDAVGVSLSYFPFERICTKTISKLKKLRRLRELHFQHTEIHSLYQLHSLGQIPSISALRITSDGNPVVNHPHFRSLVISLLPLLRTLNGSEVTSHDRESADNMWRRLRRLYGLAGNCLHAQLAPTPFQHAMALLSDGGNSNGHGASIAADDSPTSSPPPGRRPARPGTAAPTGSKESLRAQREREAEAKLDREREANSKDPINDAASAERANKLADQFVGRVVDHAMAVDEKITQLNQVWPHIVGTYQARVKAEVSDRGLFLRRYEAACRGETENTTLAMLDSMAIPTINRPA